MAAGWRRTGRRGETMRDIDLFQLALGLVPPWMVVDAKFDADKKRLDIEIDFKTGGRFACPACGKADCPRARHGEEDLAPPQFLSARGLPARARRPHRLSRLWRAPRQRALGTTWIRLHASV